MLDDISIAAPGYTIAGTEVSPGSLIPQFNTLQSIKQN
jgi:hypothetical protein